jgi:MATE family multidrug resistance protein
MTSLIGKYGKNYKSILRLAVPIIIGQLGGIITGLADTIMVGQHSTQELAAASFVNNVLNIFI